MVMYCKECQELTPHRKKGTRNISHVCNDCDSTNFPITLIREFNEIVGRGEQIRFIEWEGDVFKKLHNEPEVGLSAIIDPKYFGGTWLTTPIIEILTDEVVNSTRYIRFKTKNSNYKLYIHGEK
jgi:hypothetical protein